MTQDPVFSSATGVDAFFLIRILFAGGGTSLCDLILFGILASKSDRPTLERKEDRVNFVRWLDAVDACGKWNDNIELDE